MATQFVFLVLPHIHLMDLAGPDQVILESIGYGADFTITYCSAFSESKSSAGLPLGRMQHFSKVKMKPGDFLIVPGAEVNWLLTSEFKKEKALLQWLRDAHAGGVKLCSICAGAFVLAQADLLDHIPCTTHFKRTRQLQSLYPRAQVQENILFTEHKGIYTSAGIASGIDMALHIVEELKGAYFAHKVARELVIYNRRNGLEHQQSEMLNYRNHIHSGIHNAQDWLHEHLHEKISIPGLAEVAGMSPRNFTRVFRRETTLTVNEYVTVLRKERIAELMKNPDLSRSQIARKCGLRSERQVSRILQLM